MPSEAAFYNNSVWSLSLFQYFTTMVCLLAVIAWIGQQVHNLFLTYLIGKQQIKLTSLGWGGMVVFLCQKMETFKLASAGETNLVQKKTDNLFLFCFFLKVCIVFLFPGLNKHGVISKYAGMAKREVNKLLKHKEKKNE